jgi:hypothetical protein
VFVTGYGAETIEHRFAHVPVLQKPIERQMLEGAFARNGNGAGRATAPAAPEDVGIMVRPTVHEVPRVRSVS